MRGLLKTTIASVEATMNHVDIKPNHAPMNSCSRVWPLDRSSQKHSVRLNGNVKFTKMSGLFTAINLPVLAKSHHVDYRWRLDYNGLRNVCLKKRIAPPSGC